MAAFAVKFLVIYGALAASWPFCGAAYVFFLRESGNVLFEAVGARDKVRIRPATAPDGTNDNVLSIQHIATPGQGFKTRSAPFSSWVIGFQTTSLLIGLVLATPVSMRRRVWALFAGLVLVHAFVLARLATFVIFTPFVLPDTFWIKAFRWSVFDFFHGRAGSWLVPILIWIVVTMRQEDVRRLVGSTQKKAAA